MSEKPRRWFLLQDSTAIVAAVMLGGMFLLGLHDYFDGREWSKEYGWPLCFLQERQDGSSHFDPGVLILDMVSCLFLCCVALFILQRWRERQSGKKGRRWFQIHLVTALIVMITAGLFLAPYVLIFKDIDTMPHQYSEIVWITFLMFIGMLITVAAFCEWRIRRREARKP